MYLSGVRDSSAASGTATSRLLDIDHNLQNVFGMEQYRFGVIIAVRSLLQRICASVKCQLCMLTSAEKISFAMTLHMKLGICKMFVHIDLYIVACKLKS